MLSNLRPRARSGRVAFALAWRAAALAFAVAPASATTIDFDNLPTSTVVTSQYPGVTFSSEPGEILLAVGGTPVSYPHYLCTGTVANGIDCVNDVYIDFASAVSNVSIWAVEANEFGVVGTFYGYNGATLVGTQNLIGLAAAPNTFGYGNQYVDLSALGTITRLEIRGPGGTGPIDDAVGGVGVAWDNLSFETVPEPRTAALLGLGALAIARARRRSGTGF